MKRAVASIVIGLGGVGVFTYGLLQLMKIGTCASGNTPFVIANPSPAGTGTSILLLMGGILVTLVAIILGASADAGRPGALVLSVLFLVSGVAMLLNSLTGHGLSAGAKTAGYIIGGVFIPIGAVPFVALSRSWIGALRTRIERARSKEADATVTRVERLQHLPFDRTQIRVTHTVVPSDEASFEVSHDSDVFSNQAPRSGERVKIRYDPGHRDQFELVAPAAVSS